MLMTTKERCPKPSSHRAQGVHTPKGLHPKADVATETFRVVPVRRIFKVKL